MTITFHIMFILKSSYKNNVRTETRVNLKGQPLYFLYSFLNPNLEKFVIITNLYLEIDFSESVKCVF